MKKPKYQGLTLLEFQDRFPDEESYRQHLIQMRWPEGFACRCGSRRSAYKPSRREFQCYACQRVTSVTSGTLMHKTQVPLRKWFWCIYLLATSKKAVSTLYLSRQLRVNYKTAWSIRRKLQKAMAHRDAEWSLKGVIEADEIFIGGKQTHEERREAPNKTAFFIALEEDAAGCPKFLVTEQIESAYDENELRPVIEKHIPEGATLKTDGKGVYSKVAQEKSAVHEAVVAMNNPGLAHDHLKWINIITANLKRYLLSTHHGVFTPYRADYVAEFTYRFNRRFWPEQAFDRLLFANVFKGPTPLRAA